MLENNTTTPSITIKELNVGMKVHEYNTLVSNFQKDILENGIGIIELGSYPYKGMTENTEIVRKHEKIALEYKGSDTVKDAFQAYMLTQQFYGELRIDGTDKDYFVEEMDGSEIIYHLQEIIEGSLYQ